MFTVSSEAALVSVLKAWVGLIQPGSACQTNNCCAINVRLPCDNNGTVDWEIFPLKIIHVNIFRVIKFSWLHSICEFFLMVDDCSMDEHLESSWHLVYYQVSGEPGNAGCSRRSDIYLGECGLLRTSLFTDYRHIILFFVLNFRSWSRPRNFPNLWYYQKEKFRQELMNRHSRKERLTSVPILCQSHFKMHLIRIISYSC